MDDPGTKPPTARILAVLSAMLVLPVSSYLTGGTVGSYRMFTDLMEYRIELRIVDASGQSRALPLAALGPHLGRDAGRVILPAARFVFGETAASLAVGGLGDLGRLACAVSLDAESVDAFMARRTVKGPLPGAYAKVDCAQARAAR
jgi:hypothetical protein